MNVASCYGRNLGGLPNQGAYGLHDESGEVYRVINEKIGLFIRSARLALTDTVTSKAGPHFRLNVLHNGICSRCR